MCTWLGEIPWVPVVILQSSVKGSCGKKNLGGTTAPPGGARRRRPSCPETLETSNDEPRETNFKITLLGAHMHDSWLMERV